MTTNAVPTKTVTTKDSENKDSNNKERDNKERDNKKRDNNDSELFVHRHRTFYHTVHKNLKKHDHGLG